MSLIPERGKFLALDLGGTNFRVLIIHLKGENDFEMQSKIYAVPQNIMLGSGEQLFDHIAECLANFMKVSFYRFWPHFDLIIIDARGFFFVGTQRIRRTLTARIHIFFSTVATRTHKRSASQVDERIQL